MEHHARSIGDALFGGLNYKLKPGASYVTNRRSVSYFASGGNTYSPNCVKVMEFSLTGDQWLDPSTFRVAFELDNNNGNNADGFQIMVRPLSWNPAVFLRRARLICGGQVIEDIGGFNRLSLMLTGLLPEDDQHDIGCEGFGDFDFVEGAGAQAAGQRKSYRQTDYDLVEIGTLARFNASAVCLNSVRRSRTNMRVICFQAKVCQSISIPGIIQTSRLVLIKTSRLISLVL